MFETVELTNSSVDTVCRCGHGHSAHDLATNKGNEECSACNSIEADGNEFPTGEGCQGYSP